jgi:hypothetical protein
MDDTIPNQLAPFFAPGIFHSGVCTVGTLAREFLSVETQNPKQITSVQPSTFCAFYFSAELVIRNFVIFPFPPPAKITFISYGICVGCVCVCVCV